MITEAVLFMQVKQQHVPVADRRQLGRFDVFFINPDQVGDFAAFKNSGLGSIKIQDTGFVFCLFGQLFERPPVDILRHLKITFGIVSCIHIQTIAQGMQLQKLC